MKWNALCSALDLVVKYLIRFG